MRRTFFRFALAAALFALLPAACGDGGGPLPPPPPPTDGAVSDGAVGVDGATGAPSIVSITRADPMGCTPGVRSDVALTVTTSNTTGQVTYNWGTLSGCSTTSGASSQTATFSCPHLATYAGSVTVGAGNGQTTRAYTVPICGAPTLR